MDERNRHYTAKPQREGGTARGCRSGLMSRQHPVEGDNLEGALRAGLFTIAAQVSFPLAEALARYADVPTCGKNGP